MHAKENKYSQALAELQTQYQNNKDSFIYGDVDPSAVFILASNLIADYINSTEVKKSEIAPASSENATANPQTATANAETVFDELNCFTLKCKGKDAVDYDSLIAILVDKNIIVEGESVAPSLVNIATYDDKSDEVVRNTLCVIKHSASGFNITHYKNDKQYYNKEDINAITLIEKLKETKAPIILQEVEDINLRVNSSKGGYSIAMAIADYYIKDKILNRNIAKSGSKSDDPLYYIDSARSSQDAISIAHLNYYYKRLESGLFNLLGRNKFDMSLQADRSGHYDYKSVAKQAYEHAKDSNKRVRGYNIYYKFTQEQIHTLCLNAIYNALDREETEVLEGNNEVVDDKSEDNLPKDLLTDKIEPKKMAKIFDNLKIVEIAKHNINSNDLISQVSNLNASLSAQLNIAKPDAKLQSPVFNHIWYNQFKTSVAIMFESFEQKISKLEEKENDLPFDDQSILNKAKSAKENINKLCEDFSKLPDAKSEKDISLKDLKILIESVGKMLNNPPVKDYWVGNNWHESAGTWSAWMNWSAYLHSMGYNALGELGVKIPKIYNAYCHKNSSKFSFFNNDKSVQLEKYILEMLEAVRSSQGESAGNPDKISKTAPIYMPYTDGSHHVMIAVVYNKASSKLEVQYYNSKPDGNTGMEYANNILSGIKQLAEEKFIDNKVKKVNEVDIQVGLACGPIAASFIIHSYLKEVEGKTEGWKPFMQMMNKVRANVEDAASIFYKILGRANVEDPVILFYEILGRDFFRYLDAKRPKAPKAPKYDKQKAKAIKPKSYLDELQEGYHAVSSALSEEEYNLLPLRKSWNGNVYDVFGNIIEMQKSEAQRKEVLDDSTKPQGDAKPQQDGKEVSAQEDGKDANKPQGDAKPPQDGKGVSAQEDEKPQDGEKLKNPPISLWNKFLFAVAIGTGVLLAAATIYVLWNGGYKFKCSQNAINFINNKVQDLQEVAMDYWNRS